LEAAADSLGEEGRGIIAGGGASAVKVSASEAADSSAV